MTEETIFLEALARSAADRPRYLDQACSGQPQLRAAVEALLAAHLKPDNVLDHPPANPVATMDSKLAGADSAANGEHTPQAFGSQDAEAPRTLTTDDRRDGMAGVVIGGRYTLQEKIGEGGMGEVWVGKQTEPVKRKVALKLIKTGMDSRAVLQRFEQERQALALMDHPHIARVLDGGMTPTGQPFFVMELVKGLPLTIFCDELKLTPKARLELFVPICRAVQHAHQKGIVHRDLKPANILVTMIDGKPVPKVIDFGVAKATSGKLTEETMSTCFGAVVGTLEYMSPEQAGFSGEDIDTRADIYSLGVILYELLTGLRPIDAKRLRKAALTEMIRIIREEEPPKPSTRLSTDESLPSLAAVRQIEPKKLTALLRGELDWVVMKCLEKSRDHRYETASGLATDIQRYLNDEPVAACPPSAAYRFRKFARRNKVALLTAGLVAVALVLGLAGTTWQAIRATVAEQRAVQSAKSEAAQRRVAEAAERRAEEEAAVATAVNDFLQSDLLGMAGAESQLEAKLEPDPNIKLATLLERALSKVEKRFGDQPRVRAEVQATLADAFHALGRYEEAARLSEQALRYAQTALGPKHPATLTWMHSLARVYLDQGKYTEAERLSAQCLEVQSSVLGPEHPDTLTAMSKLAIIHQSQARYAEADTLFTKSLETRRRVLGPEHRATLLSMHHLSQLHRDQARYAEAEPLLAQCLETSRRVLGPEHPDTLAAMANLAKLYLIQGKSAEAEPLFTQCLAIQHRALGPEHHHTIGLLGHLALIYKGQGRFAEAEAIMTQCLEISRRALGPEHPNTVTLMNNLALSFQEQDKLSEAEPLHAQCLEIRRRVLGPEHPDTILSMQNLAGLYWQRRELDRSVPLFEEALGLVEKNLGRDHPTTLAVIANLGVNYKDAGRLTEGLPLLEEIHRASGKYSAYAWVADPLVDAYVRAEKFAEAARVVKESLKRARMAIPMGGPELAAVLARSGLVFLQARAWIDAEESLRECLELRERQSPDDWRTFNTKSMLGGALLGQGRYADAEPLLVAGYEGMKQRETAIPEQGKDRFPEALDRLIELYTAMDKPDEVQKWQAERAKYAAVTTATEKK